MGDLEEVTIFVSRTDRRTKRAEVRSDKIPYIPIGILSCPTQTIVRLLDNCPAVFNSLWVIYELFRYQYTFI